MEARLDLHGEFQEQAYRLLVGFLTRAAASGLRVVLVITGKGRSTTDEWGRGGGVLRRQVPHWLAQAPLAELVLATAPARPDHGGGGAMYVLLRRKRTPPA
ncbi:MAG: Smr/MutS family protein [Alphaproteobacteria bacterium]